MTRRENIFILSRIFIFAGSVLLFSYLLQTGERPVRLLFSGCLSIGLAMELMVYLTRARRRILRLLDGFAAGDPARVAESGKEQPLARALNKISDEVRVNRMDKEIQHQYLKSLVESMDIAIACFDESWNIKIANESWFSFIGRPYLTKLEEGSVPDKDLFETLSRLTPGMRESFQVSTSKGKRTYALQMENFILNQAEYKLLTAKDIEAEVQLNETEAWHKLLRVLTHEIMNSIAPVSSLSQTIHLQMEGNSTPSLQQLEDWRTAIGAISSRSHNLLDFTKAYRQLSTIPAPVKSSVPIEPLLSSIWSLLNSKHNNVSIHFALQTPVVFADPTLLEQLILNLLKNACEAMNGDPGSTIQISSSTKDHQTMITIIDNGPGIPDEILHDIFLPFFTTKEHGSGVGLSLSRQIMQAHGGSIEVGKLAGGTGTKIELRFPESEP